MPAANMPALWSEPEQTTWWSKTEIRRDFHTDLSSYFSGFFRRLEPNRKHNHLEGFRRELLLSSR